MPKSGLETMSSFIYLYIFWVFYVQSTITGKLLVRYLVVVHTTDTRILGM